MENYGVAYRSRLLDIDALLAASPQRTTTVAHLGGVAIECRLKALIVRYHAINEWGDKSNRPKDPRTLQPIMRTSHALFPAVKLMDKLYKKAMADPHFIRHLDAVNYPVGASDTDFIGLRYSSQDINVTNITNWQRSFAYVQRWLEKNEKLL
jgi:hypothetical protein